MKQLLAVFAVAVLVAGATYASDEADVMATLKGFVTAFNAGDTTAAANACAAETSIIDEFPPHEWHGAGACMKWMHDWSADADKNGITDAVVALGKPTHVDVTGKVAYVVAPADYTFKMKGKTVKERGSILAVSFIKTDNGWKMTGWSWAKH
jgi:ketosteroid isomerase-like protein